MVFSLLNILHIVTLFPDRNDIGGPSCASTRRHYPRLSHMVQLPELRSERQKNQPNWSTRRDPSAVDFEVLHIASYTHKNYTGRRVDLQDIP